MTEVIPAILAKNYKELQEKISNYANLVTTVQIDICDGIFVPSYSWPFDSQSSLEASPLESIINEESGLPYWDTIDFEFDLMVANASQKFDFFLRLGAKRMIFHLEAEVDYDKFKEFLECLDTFVRDNLEIGLAINTDTSIDKLKPFINYIDFVQFMGINNIGYQGQDFDERVIDQIKNFRLNYNDIKISVDGGVNDITAPLLVNAGADRLIVGSYLINSIDIRDSIKNLENL